MMSTSSDFIIPHPDARILILFVAAQNGSSFTHLSVSVHEQTWLLQSFNLYRND